MYKNLIQKITEFYNNEERITKSFNFAIKLKQDDGFEIDTEFDNYVVMKRQDKNFVSTIEVHRTETKTVEEIEDFVKHIANIDYLKFLDAINDSEYNQLLEIQKVNAYLEMLKNESINITEYINSPKHLKMCSENTSYIEIRKHYLINKVDFDNKFKFVKEYYQNTDSKENVKILNRINKEFKEAYNSYMIEIPETYVLFNLISNKLEKIYNRGIFINTSNDILLEDLMQLKYQYEKYFNRGTNISKIESLMNDIEKIYDNLD